MLIQLSKEEITNINIQPEILSYEYQKQYLDDQDKVKYIEKIANPRIKEDFPHLFTMIGIGI